MTAASERRGARPGSGPGAGAGAGARWRGCRRLALEAARLLAALALAGCGSAGGPSTPSRPPGTAHARSVSPVEHRSGGGFAWLLPASAPPGWTVARIADGATLASPPAWHPIHGDHGTASAAELDAAGHYLGYLNLTPRQGTESLAGWAAFRVRHNLAEGNTGVIAEESASGLHFRSGLGSCVRDSYTTSVGSRYIELACLVRGQAASSVVIGAAPAARWSAQRGAIERAISAMST